MKTATLTPANETYPGFMYPASSLAAFIFARPFNAFTYALKDLQGGGIFRPDDVYLFYCWLRDHQIREIRYYE